MARKQAYEFPDVDPDDPSRGGTVTATNFISSMGLRLDDKAFKPGVHVPKSELEEEFFEHCVVLGLARRTTTTKGDEA